MNFFKAGDIITVVGDCAAQGATVQILYHSSGSTPENSFYKARFVCEMKKRWPSSYNFHHSLLAPLMPDTPDWRV